MKSLTKTLIKYCPKFYFVVCGTLFTTLTWSSLSKEKLIKIYTFLVDFATCIIKMHIICTKYFFNLDIYLHLNAACPQY